ncbi:MAG: lysine--tRNA ligase [Pseudohongiellaceae bacterium]
MKDNETNSTVDENKLIQQRREKLQEIREHGVAFPNDFRRSAFANELHLECDKKTKEEIEELKLVASVVGRVIRIRGPFIVLLDGSGEIQLYINFKSLDEAKNKEIKSWDLGDIVAATGEVFKTGKGELSVRISNIRLVTKSLRPLPDKHKGLIDTEVRYRQRYVDLIANEEVRETFVIRSKIINAIRGFMNADNFMEVETPMLQMIPGGATARPFITHHNALDQDMYLRVAPELYLKRLVVGGFERVYEINRNFRNEGLSTRHNPEFTMLEFYQAYTDYHHLMDFTENMLRQIAEEVLGETTIIYQGISLDFAKPFTRVSFVDAIVNNMEDISISQLTNIDSVRVLSKELGIAVKDSWGVGKLQMAIFEKKVEHLLLQPTFITEYPTEVSPLARRNDTNSTISDRFELFIAGKEIANGFSELNDSEDQAKRFHAQVAEKDAGDHEAMHFDHDYITALEYGMPPSAGEGIGIDRLVMLYTDSASIRDVLLFPHMRPRHS